MLIDESGRSGLEGSSRAECHSPLLPLRPKVYDIKLYVRSGDGIADLIDMRTVARIRVTDERIDAIPLQGPWLSITSGRALPSTFRARGGSTK